MTAKTLALLFTAVLAVPYSGAWAMKASAVSNTIAPPNKKTIQWWINDLPPFLQIDSNETIVPPTAISGPLGGFYKILIASMPEYEHRILRIPPVRALRSMQENKQMCSLMVIENKERQKILYFGEEVSVGLPVGLVTLKDLPKNKIVLSPNKTDEVDVRKTMAKKNFNLGFVNGRYYSDELTPLLAKDKNSYGVVSDGSLTKLLTMLESKRLDGVFAVYLEMAEYEKQHPQGPPMQFLRVKEAPHFTALTASCEKTPWGEKTIKAISKIIREKNFKEISNSYLVSALPPARRKEYMKIYESRPTPAPTVLPTEPGLTSLPGSSDRVPATQDRN